MKNFNDHSAIARIKERWPLRAMARRLGLDLPERDNQKFRHPFRPDKNPSCTVHGEAIHDWSQGDGKPIDAIALYALAKGLANGEAIRELLHEMTGGTFKSDLNRHRPAARPDRLLNNPGLFKSPQHLSPHKPGLSTARNKHCLFTREDREPSARQAGSQTPLTPKPPPWKELETPTPDEIARLISLRRFYGDAVQSAIAARHLFCAKTREGRSWVVTDSTGQLSQSRRLDGQPWECIRSKAWTTVREPGLAGWPLGAAEIGDVPRVILCEGGPDWIVAHEALPQFAVCAMLGAKQVIHPTALPFFAGKRVRILAHGDEAGQDACLRWATQLAAVKARVTSVRIAFGPARDLNDCAALPFAEYLRHRISTLLS